MAGIGLREAAPAALIAALAVAVLAGTTSLSMWDGFTPGPGFFPRLVGVAGLGLAAAELWAARRVAPAGPWRPETGAVQRVGLTVLGMVGLAVLAPVLGMSPALAVFMLFMLTAALRRPVWPSLATAVGFAAAVEVVFVRWLGIALPPPFFA